VNSGASVDPSAKPNPANAGDLAQPFFDIATHCLKPDPQSRWEYPANCRAFVRNRGACRQNLAPDGGYSMSIAITALAVISHRADGRAGPEPHSNSRPRRPLLR